MTDKTTPRRLAAILCADVVGFSARMERDEAATLAALKAHRRLLDGAIGEHGGRIFGSAGDSVIAEFASPVAAVRCARAAQASIEAANALLAEDRRLRFRMGIALADVVVEGDNLFGDGVNIAARLQAMAEAGGVNLTGVMHDLVRPHMGEIFTDLGDRKVKNIERPIRVYRMEPQGGAGAPAAPASEKPAVAVLPFDNMSDDPRQGYFSDGITEDIITELSRFRTLFVIARNSSFAYRGSPVDLKRVSRELGVMFIVEGSVRLSGNTVRITAQLIDAATGRHLWAERYDRDIEDLFAVQDEVAHRVVALVASRLDEAELSRSRGKPTTSLTAYDLWLRGRKAQDRAKPEGDAEAKTCFEAAIRIDPRYARAWAGLAEVAYYATVYSGWGTEAAKDYDEAHRLAEKAVALDDSDAAPHAILGWIHLVRRDFERAHVHWDRAISLNPNDADVVMSRGMALAFLGEPEEALEQAELAMRLNPLHPEWYASDLAVIHFAGRRYAATLALFERVPELFPHSPAWRAAAAAYAGDGESARRYAAKFVDNIARIWAGDPAAGPRDYVQWLIDRLPFRREEDSRHLLEGLRLAGLPV